MKTKQTTRWVKVYFRDQDKVMKSIPNIEALVSKGVLVKMYTLLPRVLIYEVKE